MTARKQVGCDTLMPVDEINREMMRAALRRRWIEIGGGEYDELLVVSDRKTKGRTLPFQVLSIDWIERMEESA